MKIFFNNVRAAASRTTFDIEMNFADSSTAEYYYKLLKIGSFFYGNKSDTDSIMYPEEVSLEFSIAGCNIPIAGVPNPFYELNKVDYVKEYYAMIRMLQFVDCEILIKKNGAEFFRGFIDVKKIDSDLETLSFKIVVLSNFFKLKNISPKEVFMGHDPNGEEKILFVDLVKDILKLVYPGMGTVFLQSEIYCETTFEFAGQPWRAPAYYFGDWIYNYIGPTCRYETYIDLLKAIVNSIGCVAALNGNRFYIFNRGVKYGETINLSRYLRGKAPAATGYFNRMYRLTVNVEGVYSSHLGRATDDPDRHEILDIHFSGGIPPTGTTTRDLWIYVPEYVAGIGNAQWIVSGGNKFYSIGGPQMALWQVVRDNVWLVVQNNRMEFKAELPGVNYRPDSAFVFENDTVGRFRAKSMEVDYFGNITSVEFKQANLNGQVR